MNQAVRSWIETNFQPWHQSPERSLFLGRIGARGALPLNRDTLSYFERLGVAVEGKVFEDLLEAELLDVLDKIAAWLPPDKKRVLDDTVAFGFGGTGIPNACATQAPGGFAILFDPGFDTLLISAAELYLARMVSSNPLTEAEFALGLNTAIISEFFQAADYATPIPDEGFEYREVVEKWVWLMSVFLLGHEIGHIMRGHLGHAPTRNAVVRNRPGGDSLAVLEPAHREEFEADEYAVDLMVEAGVPGGLIRTGTEPGSFWNSAYVTLGWLFTVFDAVERLGKRIGTPIQDTHPPAAARWARVEAMLRERTPISPDTVRLDQATRAAALTAASAGSLPTIHKDRATTDSVAMPYSVWVAGTGGGKGMATKPSWIPDLEIFMAWIEARTPEEAEDVLKRHPEMLHPNVDVMHYRLADKQRLEAAWNRIVFGRLPLLQRCRAIGIEAAFEEFRAGRSPIRKVPVSEYELPLEAWKEYVSAFEQGDEERMKHVVDASPNLATFLRLNDTALELVSTRSPAQAEALLERHPELLHPVGDSALLKLKESQQSDASRARVETFRTIVARSLEVGIARAIVEWRVEVGVDELGRSLESWSPP